MQWHCRRTPSTRLFRHLGNESAQALARLRYQELELIARDGGGGEVVGIEQEADSGPQTGFAKAPKGPAETS